MNISHPSMSALLRDSSYARLKERFIAATGLAYYGSHDEELAARIARRLDTIGMASLDDYAFHLLNSEDAGGEWDALISEVTIGETSFFRHREQFDALRDRILPELIHRNRHSQRLRIWSAGCATGAEAYSLSILVRREFGRLLGGWDVTITGTDINRAFLAQAESGVFAEWAFRSGTEGIRDACCEPLGQRWSVKPEYRQGVTFHYHNLVQPLSPALLSRIVPCDLILCRNVMIYFEADAIGRLVAKFHEALADGGWLVVGHAEPNVEVFRSFSTVNAPGAVLYRKLEDGSPAAREVCDRSKPTDTPALAAKGLASGRQGPLSSGTVMPRGRPRQAVTKRTKASKPAAGAWAGDIREKIDRGEWSDAARCVDAILSVDRLNPLAHFYHALVLEQQGLIRESGDALRRAIYLDRECVLAHYHLGLLMLRHGNASDAKRSFRNTIALLDCMSERQVICPTEGLTAGDLKQSVQTQLEALCHA